MKRRVFLSSSLLVLAALPVFAHGAPRGEAKVMLAGKAVSIDYGRPSLQGRDALSLATPGEPWRMGADAATTLTSAADLAFGSVAVPKGSYILTATKDDKGGWTLNVRDKDDRKNVIASVPLTPAPLAESVELFTIELKGEKDKGSFTMSWGMTAFSAGFTGK
jgi:hypothetical protein